MKKDVCREENRPSDGEKKCTWCKEVLPLSAFARDGKKHYSRCKACVRALRKERRKEGWVVPPHKYQALMQKFAWDADGCSVWQGAIGSSGYGEFGFDGKGPELVHRLMYQLAWGDLSPDHETWTIDHLCGKKLCGLPMHLVQITRKQNASEGAKSPWAMPDPSMQLPSDFWLSAEERDELLPDEEVGVEPCSVGEWIPRERRRCSHRRSVATKSLVSAGSDP